MSYLLMKSRFIKYHKYHSTRNSKKRVNFCPNVAISLFGKLESSVKQKINFLWSLCNSNENLRPPDMHYKYEQGEIIVY